jgi:two-component system sensor histidine kinase KdpD
MLHGNIYPPEKVPKALTNFFREDNLMALRELALRFLADETEEELLAHLRARQTDVLWETSERILVGITAAPGTDTIVRRASRMASRIKAELHVLHIISDDGANRSHDAQLDLLRQLTTDVGAHWNEVRADDPAQALFDFARSHQITQIVVGSSGRSRWQELKSGGSIVRKISQLAAPVGIDVHIIARRDLKSVLPESNEVPEDH